MSPLLIGALVVGLLVGFLVRGAAAMLTDVALRGVYVVVQVTKWGLILVGAIAVVWLAVAR